MEFKEVMSDIKIFSKKNSDYRILLNGRHLFGYANETDKTTIGQWVRQQHPRPRKIITEYSVFKRIGGSYRYVPHTGNIYFYEYHLVMIILRNKYEAEIKTIGQPKPTIPKSSGNTSTTTSGSDFYRFSTSPTATNI